MVWSWGSVVDGSWLVGNWSRLVGSWSRLVRSVFGLSRVGNISNIARVSISNIVGHSLDATVGKGNRVLSLGGVSITGLISSKVESSIFITDGILVLVDCWIFLVGRSWVVRGGFVGWSRVIRSRGWVVGSGCWVVSKGNSQESRQSNKGL
uniref:Uncharacterized protein n=1 Tax=Lepeophtheirus salmonis TaxID=72036 RepID=A0A0K2UF24_LEPSM